MDFLFIAVCCKHCSQHILFFVLEVVMTTDIHVSAQLLTIYLPLR